MNDLQPNANDADAGDEKQATPEVPMDSIGNGLHTPQATANTNCEPQVQPDPQIIKVTFRTEDQLLMQTEMNTTTKLGRAMVHRQLGLWQI
jgi:hypothetical protein